MPVRVERDYEKALDALIDELFNKATYDHDWSWNHFAVEAKLAPTTVTKLGNRETRLPQLRTIFRLAKAVGMDVGIVKRRLRVRKVA